MRADSPTNPPNCPEFWTEAGLAWVNVGSPGKYCHERTCYNMDNSCSVMYLRADSPTNPPNCPEFWTEAGLAWVNAGAPAIITMKELVFIAHSSF